MWRMALSNSTLHFQFILKLLSKACRVANVSPEKLFELLGRSCQTLSNVVEDCISSSKNWDLCCRGVPQKITLFPREDKRENDRSIYHRTWKGTSHFSHRYSDVYLEDSQEWYCWWTRSCIILGRLKPSNHRISSASAGAGFVPSIVCLWDEIETIQAGLQPTLILQNRRCLLCTRIVEGWHFGFGAWCMEVDH